MANGNPVLLPDVDLPNLEPTTDFAADESEQERQKRLKAEGRAGLMQRKTTATQQMRGLLPAPEPEEVKEGIIQRNLDQARRDTLQDNSPMTERDKIITQGLAEQRADFLKTHRQPLKIPEGVGMAMVPFAEDDTIDRVDVFNFLLGGELGMMGIKYDNDGFSWNIENMKQKWSEDPLWVNLLDSVSLVGAMVFPGVMAGRASLKFGKAGKLLGRFGSREDEIAKLRALKLIDDKTKDSEITGSVLQKIREIEYNKTRYDRVIDRIQAAERGDVKLGRWESVKAEFDRRFANQYFNMVNDVNEGTGHMQQYKDRLDAFFKHEDIGNLFMKVPEAVAGKKIYSYWLNRMKPGTVKAPGKLSAEERQWADMLFEKMRAHQDEALQEGLITDETYRLVGPVHVPIQKVGTADPGLDVGRTYVLPIKGQTRKTVKAIRAEEEEVAGFLGRKRKRTRIVPEEEEYIALKTYDFPRLDSPTLTKARHADLPEVARRIQTGDWITDPAELGIRGYVTDRLLLQNFKMVRDIAMDGRYSFRAADVMFQYKGNAKAIEKAGLISLSQAGGDAERTIRRMLKRKRHNLPDDEALPYVRREVFEDIFGERGSISMIQAAGDFMELLTTAYKTSRTALNPATHATNLMGNLAMMHQAGVNPMSPKNVDIMFKMATAFNKIAELNTQARKSGVSARSLFDPKSGLLKGVKLGSITVNNKKFDLSKELLDPMVRELIEESAFEAVEGFAHMERLLGRLRQDQRFTRWTAKKLLGVRSTLQAGNRLKWFDNMTKWYLGEDMIPKMTMYMHYRGLGLSKKAAVLETGRRLPMYKTVGSGIRFGRRFFMPWATFPTEAMRITKNNLFDHPIRMMPWLQLPQIMQTMVSGMGAGPGSFEAVEQAKKSMPFYAQKGTTVATTGEAATQIGGATTGALGGFLAGGRLGGAPGAFAGAALGGVAGAGIASGLTEKDQSDRMRGALLDWLPHSAFMLTTTSEEFGTDTVPWQNMRGLLEQMPAEPLAILKPMMDIYAGRTPWGTELVTEDTGDMMGKVFSGFIGLMAPTFIQRYGLRTTTPDVSLTQALAQAAGYESSTGIPGDFTNVSRLLTDTGSAIDPVTMKPGSLTHDFLLNFAGVWRNYVADPNTRLANEALAESAMGDTRTYLSRQLGFHLQNGDDALAMDILTKVMNSFSAQHPDDPGLANQKYEDWLVRRTRDIGKHPKLRDWSEEELIRRLREAFRFSGEVRVQAREELIKALQNELRIRRAAKSKAGSKPSFGF